jgi:polyphosphate kinase
MPRNLYERCEVVFPVVAPIAMRRLRDEILECYLRDVVKARLMQADGTYTRAPKPSSPQRSAQDWLMQLSLNPEHKLGAESPASQPPQPANITTAR